MKTNELILRCYAKKQSDNTWKAACVDLNLSARGNTGQEAIDKLYWMIKRHAYYANWPFTRISLPLLINYYWIKFRAKPYKLTLGANAYFFTTRFPIPPTD